MEPLGAGGVVGGVAPGRSPLFTGEDLAAKVSSSVNPSRAVVVFVSVDAPSAGFLGPEISAGLLHSS